MRIDYHKQFQKQYKKLPSKVREKFAERLVLFVDNPFAPELSNHALHGKYAKYRSINITGDWRVFYEVTGEGVQFSIIDTHSNLYG